MAAYITTCIKFAVTKGVVVQRDKTPLKKTIKIIGFDFLSNTGENPLKKNTKLPSQHSNVGPSTAP